MQPVRARRILPRVLLRHGADETVTLKRLLDEAHRGRSAGTEWHHRLRKEHGAAQGQDSDYVRHHSASVVLRLCHAIPLSQNKSTGPSCPEAARTRASRGSVARSGRASTPPGTSIRIVTNKSPRVSSPGRGTPCPRSRNTCPGCVAGGTTSTASPCGLGRRMRAPRNASHTLIGTSQ